MGVVVSRDLDSSPEGTLLVKNQNENLILTD